LGVGSSPPGARAGADPAARRGADRRRGCQRLVRLPRRRVSRAGRARETRRHRGPARDLRAAAARSRPVPAARRVAHDAPPRRQEVRVGPLSARRCRHHSIRAGARGRSTIPSMLSLRRAFALLALALVVAPLVASAPLFDPDEGLHAAIAQEMNARGDYVTPTFLGEPFLDKPILFFWAEALSLRVIGHNEAAVRIPPLLFGLFGMIAVAALGRALFDETAGLAAGIAYGTMLLPLGVSEVAVHDIGLVGFMCIACWCMWRIAEPSASVASTSVASAFRRKSVLVVLAGVCLGLSILTKGLVGVVFTGIFAACLAVYRPAAIVRLAIALAIAGAIALLVAAPWYIAMERAHPGYLHYYFVERHLQGYLTATQRHAGRPFWYYVPIVLGGALPW